MKLIASVGINVSLFKDVQTSMTAVFVDRPDIMIPHHLAPHPLTDNPIENYCNRLDYVTKLVITAASLVFTGYSGYRFYEGVMIASVNQSVAGGIFFVGGMLVSCHMFSVLREEQESHIQANHIQANHIRQAELL